MLERKKTGFSLISNETEVSLSYCSPAKPGISYKQISGSVENECLSKDKSQGEWGVFHVRLYVL